MRPAADDESPKTIHRGLPKIASDSILLRQIFWIPKYADDVKFNNKTKAI